MQYSVLSVKEVVGDFRIDAEAYLPKYLQVETILEGKEYTTLGKETKVFAKGIFDIKAECYLETEGIPFIRIGDLGDVLLNNSYVRIPKTENEKNKRTFLQKGDLVISKTAYAAASLVSIECCNVSQDIIAVKLKDTSAINSHFLALFLNCSYGLLQMQRWFSGNIQTHLNLVDSSSIKIPILDKSFQLQMERYVERALEFRDSASSQYLDAEQILLSELGLMNWRPKHQLSFVKNFSDSKNADRIDAEYFQPMHDELIEKIKQYKNGHKTIGDCLTIKDKNFTPKDDVKYKYIELANISADGHINGFIEAMGKELPTRARLKVNSGDVIVSSIEGSLSSIALINVELDNALCSTGFYVVNSDMINSETLLVLLKSPVGQLQLRKGCSGTILTAINKDEFKRISLPNISQSIQEEIKQKISEMYKAKSVSKKLLDIAKRGVEIAIEQGEVEAHNWIDQEIRRILPS